jgi:2-(1,2-epoxy-1,2-dihydrophenyl)acetyl-CoA isomerase
VGLKKSLWLALRNPTLSAEDARALGLVNEVFPATDFEAGWRTLATELAAGPTLAYAAAKRLLRGALGRDLEAQMEDERDAITACARTADFLEGCMAFAEKRKARYEGR